MLVSATDGAVGSVVGQIAKILGWRTAGISSSAEKCRWLKEALGYDDAINHRDPAGLAAQLARALLRDMSNKPPFMMPEKVLHTISRYLIGDHLADEFGIRAWMPVEVAIHFARAGVRVGSLGLRLLPDAGQRQLEKAAHAFGGRSIRHGLGSDPATWGFRSMA